MEVTLDSHEPLADALRVISSMYGVTLTITLTTADGSSAADIATRPSKRAPSKKSTATNRRGTKTAVGARVDPKLIRQWAWENGHEVNARGSLPASVRDAYRAANPS